MFPLHWRHNDNDGVSNHQPHGCLLNRLFRRRSKKTSKLRVTGLCVGNSPGPVNSPHKRPVPRKMFPFDEVIMRGIFRLQHQKGWPWLAKSTGILHVLVRYNHKSQQLLHLPLPFYEIFKKNFNRPPVFTVELSQWRKHGIKISTP